MFLMGNYVIFFLILFFFVFWLGIDALCSMGSDPWSSFTPTLYIDKNMEMDDLLLLYDLREGEL